jgi:hypothetical protein
MISTIDFSNLDAKDVRNEDAFPEYERGMDFFYLEQLVPFNASIYVMEHILRFPFGLFTDFGDRIFFTLVLKNFFQAGLLTITRLATDTKGDLYTLLQFKNWVCQQVRPQYRDDFQAHLRRTRFDKKTRAMFSKAKQLRDGQVAHLKRDFNISEQDRLDFEELKTLRDSLNFVLDALSFNVDRVMLPIQYSPRVTHPTNIDSRSDIEKLLDGIARNSVILNLPEDEPEYWPTYRKNLSERELEALNEYRFKFGLPAVQ